jgi:hypothetical protein
MTTMMMVVETIGSLKKMFRYVKRVALAMAKRLPSR